MAGNCILGSFRMAPADTPTAPEQPPFTHNLRLLFQMLLDRGVAVQPFVGLSRFTFFAVMRRYDEEPELENLNRPAWNQLCADLLPHVAGQIP